MFTNICVHMDIHTCHLPLNIEQPFGIFLFQSLGCLGANLIGTFQQISVVASSMPRLILQNKGKSLTLFSASVVLKKIFNFEAFIGREFWRLKSKIFHRLVVKDMKWIEIYEKQHARNILPKFRNFLEKNLTNAEATTKFWPSETRHKFIRLASFKLGFQSSMVWLKSSANRMHNSVKMMCYKAR